MSRCRETAGILFKKRCQFPSTQACAQCSKPICRAHVRMVDGRELCITCGRTEVGQEGGKRSMAHLEDDPYFYWYYGAGQWFDHGYSRSDYDAFAATDGDFADGVEDHWEGT